MGDRIIVAIVIGIITIVPGVLSILKPEMMYKTSATYVYPKAPSKAAIKRFKISGYVFTGIGTCLIIVALTGGLKGI